MDKNISNNPYALQYLIKMLNELVTPFLIGMEQIEMVEIKEYINQYKEAPERNTKT